MVDKAQLNKGFSLGKLEDFPHGVVGGEKLGLKLNSAQLGLEAWAELGNTAFPRVGDDCLGG